MHTTACPHQDYPSRSNCGLLDHASMFDEWDDRVKGELLWTIFERWRLEARGQKLSAEKPSLIHNSGRTAQN